MRFGHEYRFLIGLIGIMFVFSGLIDALTEDFTLKYFITLGIFTVLFWVAIYEMIWYPKPDNPLLESILALVALVSAALGVHGAVWLVISIMIGRVVGESIWLAPNVVASKTVFYAMTFTCLSIYIAVLATVNLLSDESPTR